jgi:hypothetical protein
MPWGECILGFSGKIVYGRHYGIKQLYNKHYAGHKCTVTSNEWILLNNGHIVKNRKKVPGLLCRSILLLLLSLCKCSHKRSRQQGERGRERHEDTVRELGLVTTVPKKRKPPSKGHSVQAVCMRWSTITTNVFRVQCCTNRKSHRSSRGRGGSGSVGPDE